MIFFTNLTLAQNELINFKDFEKIEKKLTKHEKLKLEKLKLNRFFKSIDFVTIFDLTNLTEGTSVKFKFKGKNYKFLLDYVRSDETGYYWVGYGKKGERLSYLLKN